MVAEVVGARWATTPIDVTFVGVEANVDTSVGQNDVIGVTRALARRGRRRALRQIQAVRGLRFR